MFKTLQFQLFTFRFIKTSSNVVCLWILAKITTMPLPHIFKLLTSIRIVEQTSSHYYYSMSLDFPKLPEWGREPSWNSNRPGKTADPGKRWILRKGSGEERNKNRCTMRTCDDIHLWASSYEPGNRASSVTGTNSVVCSYGKFQPGRPGWTQETQPKWWNINLYWRRAKQLSTVAILLYRFLSCWCLETFFT